MGSVIAGASIPKKCKPSGTLFGHNRQKFTPPAKSSAMTLPEAKEMQAG